jgi:hypothetical protein
MNSYTNLANPAIIFAFLITFIDEIGEIKDLTNKKVLLIGGALVFIYLIYSKQVSVNKHLQNIPMQNIPINNITKFKKK